MRQIFEIALMHHQTGHLALAEDLYRQILAGDPDHFDALHLLSLIVAKAGHYKLADEYLSRAMRLKPDFAVARFNHGIILRKLGKFAEATASYREAIRLQSDHTEAHCNLGMLYLLQGNFEQGWQEYEWRLRLRYLNIRDYPQPRWDGSSLAGQTILLHHEQGLGDTLQFTRFTPLVKSRGGTVLLECPATLATILGTCAGIDRVVIRGEPLPPFDVHAPLMSLPGILKINLETIPASVPYLKTDPNLVQDWQKKLSSYDGLKIGIAWQGDPRAHQPNFSTEDRARSIPLKQFEVLARIPNVRLFSLQKGFGTEQLAQWDRSLEIVDLAEGLHDFADTAAVMMNLDLIVSADTSPIHLAGALSRNVWTPLPLDASWRWLLGREDTPWYPTMRLFRQKLAGDWAAVFERMAEEIRRLKTS